VTCFICSFRNASAGTGGTTGAGSATIFGAGWTESSEFPGGSNISGGRGHGTESGQGTDPGVGTLTDDARAPPRKGGSDSFAVGGVIADKGFGTNVDKAPFAGAFGSVRSDRVRFLGDLFVNATEGAARILLATTAPDLVAGGGCRILVEGAVFGGCEIGFPDIDVARLAPVSPVHAETS
jgi:hypothetical protein